MSSARRAPSQIGVRVKYLIGINGSVNEDASGVAINGVPAIILPEGTYPGAVATAAEVEGIADYDNYIPPSAGDLYKDMGRSITVVDADGNHLALYRNVQIVSGPGSEGVPDNSPSYDANIYLRIWAADGLNVLVARLG